MDKKLFNHMIFTLCTLISLIIIGIVLHVDYCNGLSKNTFSKLSLNSESYSVFIGKEVQSSLTTLKSTGDMMESLVEADIIEDTNANYLKIQKVFDDINKSKGMINSIYYISNSSGNLIDLTGFIKKEALATDIRHREWYLEATKYKEPSISAVYTDLYTNKPCITLCYCLYKDNKFIGIIAADVFLQDLNSNVLRIDNPNYKTYVLNNSNIIMLSPDASLLGSPVNKLKDNVLSSLLKGNNLENLEKINSKLFACSTDIPSLNWKVVTTSNQITEGVLIRNNLFKLTFALSIIGIFLIFIINFIYSLSYSIDGITKLNTKYKLIKDIKKNSYENIYVLFISLKNTDSIISEFKIITSEDVIKIYSDIIKDIFLSKKNIAYIEEDTFAILLTSKDKDSIDSFVAGLVSRLETNNISIHEKLVSIEAFVCLIKFESQDIKEINKAFSKAQKIIENLKAKNSSFVNSSMANLIMLESETENKIAFLKDALNSNKIRPYFQPIININSGEIEKYEVLMRIVDNGTILNPYPFILIAEKYKLIEPLDLQILEKSLIYKNQIDPEDKIIFSLNISGMVLQDSNYLNKAAILISNYNVKYSNIIFELTETEKMNNISNLSSIIHEFKEKGFKFAIDDFGNGYSSIYYLKNIPVDYLKIDGSFIRDMNKNKENFYLVQSIVDMAKAFNLKTVAEYTENQEILNSLAKLGVDYAQGYYIGKPEENIQ